MEVYINFTGLMWELGRDMNALLIFAEVRFAVLGAPCSPEVSMHTLSFQQTCCGAKSFPLLQHRYYGESQPFGTSLSLSCNCASGHTCACMRDRYFRYAPVKWTSLHLTRLKSCADYLHFALQARAVLRRTPRTCR